MIFQPIIAQKPASPRDSSKLLVYDSKNDQVFIDKFYHLDRYLPKNSFLVLNKTKVIPSRIWLYKETGGKVKVLFLLNKKTDKENEVDIMVDRKIETDKKLYFDKSHYIKIIANKEKIFTAVIPFGRRKLLALLDEKGTMPIPPYIKNTSLTESDLRKKYQTIFAKEKGSIAAPTASLHFTRRVFNKLEQKGINRYYLTLHVGLGTFAPVTSINLATKTLHQEYYEIPHHLLQCIKTLKREKMRLVAVGTTVVRALESFGYAHDKSKNYRSTDLFIFPPYDFKMVDCLITNFHLPGTSLQMLVDAFLRFKEARKKIKELYELAMQEKFRFYSFGDVMLIL